ncbi:hypothetical protein [Streptomyces sp. NBC_01304]|uniref:hypothetical protein n=1 Tax=Streptomyces sp. NBC_01304 TaxID=2903818 RepID=UPI002E118B1D|nr:hypothetical protein OG430_24520 [Streptomyces sp. NBC_01304]
MSERPDELAAAERELRDFLERAVPRPAAPEGRMGRVRELVVRRRRRRNAGVLGVAAVAGAVLAGTLLPSGSGADPDLVPPAASPAGKPVPYPDLAGLRLRLPAGWQGEQLLLDGQGADEPVGVAATQPLGEPRLKYCVQGAPRSCAVIGRLRSPDDALLLLRVDRTPVLAAKARSGPRLDPVALSKSCQVVGGAEEYYGLLRGPAPDTTVVVTLCVGSSSDAGARRLEEARRALASADFGPGASDDSPTPGGKTPSAP